MATKIEKHAVCTHRSMLASQVKQADMIDIVSAET